METLFVPPFLIFLAVSAYLCKKKGWQIHYLVWGAIGGLVLGEVLPWMGKLVYNFLDNLWTSASSMF